MDRTKHIIIPVGSNATAVIYCPKGAAAQDYIDSFSREYKIIGEPEYVAGDVNEDSVVDSSVCCTWRLFRSVCIVSSTWM